MVKNHRFGIIHSNNFFSSSFFFFFPLPFRFNPRLPRLCRFAGNESHNFRRNSRKKFSSLPLSSIPVRISTIWVVCKSREEKYLSTRLVDICRRHGGCGTREGGKGGGKTKYPSFIRSFAVTRVYLASYISRKAGSETNFFLKSPISLALSLLFFIFPFFFFHRKSDETIDRTD